jgi:hypothetical protein
VGDSRRERRAGTAGLHSHPARQRTRPDLDLGRALLGARSRLIHLARGHLVRAKGLEPPPPKGPGPKPAGERPGMSVWVRESPCLLGICELTSVAVPVYSDPSVHFG